MEAPLEIVQLISATRSHWLQGNYAPSKLACRLIPLNKYPGLRPIGVGEILRRVIGIAVISVNRDSIIKSVGSLQVCAGHEACCEAAVHAMRELFNEQDTQAILIVDAANAFNSVNRNVFLHNIKVICPEISIFVANCYSTPSRLFIIGGVDISSAEGTTQGDPVAMAVYATAIIPLILMVLEITDKLPNSITKCEAYADNIAAGGTLENMLEWWKAICELQGRIQTQSNPAIDCVKKSNWSIIPSTRGGYPEETKL